MDSCHWGGVTGRPGCHWVILSKGRGNDVGLHYTHISSTLLYIVILGSLLYFMTLLNVTVYTLLAYVAPPNPLNCLLNLCPNLNTSFRLK